MSDLDRRLEANFSLSALRTAEAAIREEPYPRLPALAGTLALAAHRLESIQRENERLRDIAERLRDFGSPETTRDARGWVLAKGELNAILESGEGL